jgi:hypothetical protein
VNAVVARNANSWLEGGRPATWQTFSIVSTRRCGGNENGRDITSSPVVICWPVGAEAEGKSAIRPFSKLAMPIVQPELKPLMGNGLLHDKVKVAILVNINSVN